MVGGVAGRLIRDAACPVIVVPRGAGHTEANSLFATEYTGSSKRVRVPAQPGVHRIQTSAVLVKLHPSDPVHAVPATTCSPSAWVPSSKLR